MRICKKCLIGFLLFSAMFVLASCSGGGGTTSGTAGTGTGTINGTAK